MRAARRIAFLALSVLLIGAMGKVPEAEPLPSACDILTELPADTLPGQSLDYQTTQDRSGNDILMSMCSALGDDGLPAVTLLLRQNISESDPQTALAQREIMIAELAQTFGSAPQVTLPDIGEAALWVAEIAQLTVWYRRGRVMFIVTTGNDSPDTRQKLSEQIARKIVARFP